MYTFLYILSFYRARKLIDNEKVAKSEALQVSDMCNNSGVMTEVSSPPPGTAGLV